MIAIVYTIKNEAEIILANIEYHRTLGVSRFLVYLDKSTDRSREILEKQPDVILRPHPQNQWAI